MNPEAFEAQVGQRCYTCGRIQHEGDRRCESCGGPMPLVRLCNGGRKKRRRGAQKEGEESHGVS